MAVAGVTQFQVHPGGMETFMAILAEATVVLEKHGATVRWWINQLAGQDSGLIGVTGEYENWSEYGAAHDKLAVDPEFLALQSKLQASDSPASIVSMSVVAEIPRR